MNKNPPLYNSRITNTYLEYLAVNHPDINIEQLLEHARIKSYEAEDPAHWLTQKQVDRFHDALVNATQNPDIARDAGRFTAFTQKIGAIKEITLGMMSPASVYLKAGKLYATMSRGATIETQRLSPSKVQLTATPNPGVEEKRYQCENRKGTLESLAKLFTKDFAQVDHPDCFHEGDSSCRYVISWTMTDSMRWKRISRLAALATLMIMLLAYFALPVAVWIITVLMSGMLSLGLLVFSFFKENKELAQTIENQGNAARDLLKSANERYSDSTLMQEIGCASVTITDIEQYIHTVLGLMAKRLSFDRGLIMLEKNQKQKLQYVASYGHSAEHLDALEKAEFQLGNPESQGLFVKAFREQEPYVVEDIEKITSSLSVHSREFATIISSKAFICTPIVYQKEAFGIIAVDNLYSETTLTKSHLSIVKSIASQIAAGIANARIIKKLLAGEEKYRDLYQESKKGEALYRSLIHSSADAIILFDLALTPQYISPEFESTFQWTLEDLQQNGKSVIPQSMRDTIQKLLKDVMKSGNPIRGFETKLYAKNGKLLHVSISASRYVGHDQKPAGLLIIIRNISEKKKLENQLQHAQKMEAIGTLAGGIAHDFNNLLSVVQGNISLMKMDFDSDSPLIKRMQNIEKQIKSGSKLTSQLLGYARKGNYQIQPVNLTGLIRETTEAFGRTRKEISIFFSPPQDTFIVDGDQGQIEQVLYNLFINAADAMPDGGDLALSLQFVGHDRINAENYTPEPGVYIFLEVSDTGIGMSPDVRQRVFDPFFTTKKMGKGTGLGLASVYGIVKNHNGYIEIESQPGQGTRIQIYLPASNKSTAADKKIQNQSLMGKGTILFVDDEPMLLEIGAEMLEKIGYKVLSAASGPEALDIFKREMEHIDLVLLDMIMPGMNGGELFDKLKKIQPDLKAILSSGYSIDGHAREIMERGCNGFMQKPFDLKTLSTKIRNVLERELNDG